MPVWWKTNIVRWPLYLALFCVIAVSLVVIILPYTISKEALHQSFEREISNFLGHTVRAGNAPKIEFWPIPTIVLENIVVGEDDDLQDTALLVADRISAQMSFVSMLEGEPRFSKFSLIRPTIRVERYADGSSNWLSSKGQLSQLFRPDETVDLTAPAEENSAAIVAQDILSNIGSFRIEGGTVEFTTDPGLEPERTTAINGVFELSQSATSASLDLSAILRGEEMNIKVSTPEFDKLISKQNTSLNLIINSALANLNFVGKIELSDNFYADGTLAFDTPSVRRALEWSRNNIRPGAALGAIELSTDIIVDTSSVKLDDLIILIGENRGLGLLEFTFSEDVPDLLAGTLAFNTLDVDTFFRAFTPLPQSSDDIADTINTDFLKQLGLDLRLSAQNAKLGPIYMTNLAAAVDVTQNEATFKIGDANAYGGRLLGSISINDSRIEGGEISISARDMNIGDFFDAIALDGPLPRGTGQFDLNLKSEKPIWAMALQDVVGDFKLQVSDGQIPGIDIENLITASQDSDFIELKTLTDGSFAFDLGDVVATIGDGNARLQTASFVGSDYGLKLSGIIPFTLGSLAMRGDIYNTQSSQASDAALGQLENPDKPELTFFVGGSWQSPILSPLSALGNK